MDHPVTQQKYHLKSINNRLLFWEILLSLAITSVISLIVSVAYNYGFTAGTPRSVFLLCMGFIILGFFIITLLTVNVWDRLALKKTLKKRLALPPSPRHNTRVAIRTPGNPSLRNTAGSEDTTACVNRAAYQQDFTSDTYQSFVGDGLSNQMHFQATEIEQSVSQNSEQLNAEFIKRRLMEKETRIIEIVDVQVARQPDNMYDFAATIYVSAKSLRKAAEIVDSANSILHDEFDIKDTKLLPVITSR